MGVDGWPAQSHGPDMAHARLIGFAAVLLLATLGVAGATTGAGASQPVSTRITITPSRGIASGSNVVIKGVGFQPANLDGSVIIWLCVPGNPGSDPMHCDYPGAASPGADGTFRIKYKMHMRGTSFVGGSAIDCAAVHCVVDAVQGAHFGVLEFAERAVRFEPKVVADCKLGHWRNVSNDQGARFTDQKSCVNWLAAHPRAA